MKYELSEQEIQHIERYRDLLPELQAVLDSKISGLHELQTFIIKGMTQAE